MIPAKINKLLDSIYKGLNEHRLNDEWLKGYRLGLRDAAVAVYQVGFDDGAKATARFQAGFLEAQKWWAERWQKHSCREEDDDDPENMRINDELYQRTKEILKG